MRGAFFHLVKPLLKAWMGLRLKPEATLRHGAKGNPKPTRTRNAHGRHTAFFELP
jgi:hypothetical protein